MRARACGAALAIVMSAAPPVLAKDKAECAAAAVAGQELERFHKLSQARDQFAACATDECPEVIAHDCSRWLKDLATRIPTVDLSSGPGVGATIDGREVPLPATSLALDPGAHVVVFRAPGYVTQTKRVDLAEGAHLRLDVPLVAEALVTTPIAPTIPEGHGHRGVWLVSAITASALTLAGFGVFAGFGASGNADQSSLRTSCAPFCTQAQIDPVASEYTWANVGLGVGLVALVATAVTWYLTLRPR
ncbi:MAG TPA: hypothetical protein VGH28_30980 [Polyangiaceae bacterium]|jgi:hypothetical protein